jgi:hypothetical protein
MSLRPVSGYAGSEYGGKECVAQLTNASLETQVLISFKLKVKVPPNRLESPGGGG